MPAQNDCPHPQCDNSKPYEHFSCKKHWFQLPGDLRNEISAAWRKGGLCTEWIEAQKKAFKLWKEKM